MREALDSAESKAAEATKLADSVREKYNDVQLRLHEAGGREQCVQRELDESKSSLETEIKRLADREAELLREQVKFRKGVTGRKVRVEDLVHGFAHTETTNACLHACMCA